MMMMMTNSFFFPCKFYRFTEGAAVPTISLLLLLLLLLIIDEDFFSIEASARDARFYVIPLIHIYIYRHLSRTRACELVIIYQTRIYNTHDSPSRAEIIPLLLLLIPSRSSSHRVI